MTETPPEPDFPDPNTLAQPATDPDSLPDQPPEQTDDSGDAVPDTD